MFPDDFEDDVKGPDRGWNDEPSRAELFEGFAAPVYTTDAAGWLTYYNGAAAELWGYRPALGRTRWCGAWKTFSADGQPMPLDRCPMAITLREGRAVRGMQAVLERPDGTRVPFMSYPTPLRDASGTLVAASNVLLRITRPGRPEPAAPLLGRGYGRDEALDETSDEAWDTALDGALAASPSDRLLAGIAADDLTGSLQVTLAALADVEFAFRADRERLDDWVGPAAERERILAQLEGRRNRERARLSARLDRLRQHAGRVMAVGRPTVAARGATLH